MAAAAVLDNMPATKSKLPHLAHNPSQSVYEGRFNDRAPAIQTAGTLTSVTGDTVHQCMNMPPRPESPDIVRRFRATVSPASGKQRVFYGRSRDPQQEWAKLMTHGGKRPVIEPIKPIVNPNPLASFQNEMKKRSEMIYESTKRKPLGRTSLTAGANLPRGLDPVTHTFGATIIRSGNSGELISPPKSSIQVYAEGEVGRDLYRRSHTALWPSEQHHRNYTIGAYTPHNTFGVPTPHDNEGRATNACMHWMHSDTAIEPIVSKRADIFRERTQPQIGKVHDPIADTLNVGPHHTFGILSKPEAYGVGDLVHYRSADRCLHGTDQVHGIVNMIRYQLKAVNYHNFDDLLAAFIFYDKKCTGKIDASDLRQVCQTFELPADPQLMKELVQHCDTNSDGFIDYKEFANFLNWKEQMPSGLLLPSKDGKAGSTEELRVPFIKKQVDGIVGDHRLSSQVINAVVGPNGTPTNAYRTYGVPSIRTDLPAPRMRRVCDRTNYGDESDAYGLVNPSVYSNQGAYEKDFLKPRTPAEIRELLVRIGVEMDDETLCRIYKMAGETHPKGTVSVETFRNVMDTMQATMMGKSNVI